MRRKLMFLIIGILCLIPGISMAELINPGFETGDLTGWTINTIVHFPPDWGPYEDGEAKVFCNNPNFSAKEGDCFLDVRTTSGSANSNVPDDTRVSQAVYLKAGEQLYGWVAYMEGPEIAETDGSYAYVQIQHGNMQGPFDSPLLIHYNADGDLKWKYWSYIAPSTGYYTLHYGQVSAISQIGGTALFDIGPSKGRKGCKGR